MWLKDEYVMQARLVPDTLGLRFILMLLQTIVNCLDDVWGLCAVIYFDILSRWVISIIVLTGRVNEIFFLNFKFGSIERRKAQFGRMLFCVLILKSSLLLTKLIVTYLYMKKKDAPRSSNIFFYFDISIIVWPPRGPPSQNSKVKNTLI